MLSEHCVPLIFFRVFSHLVYTSSHTSHTRGFSADSPFFTLADRQTDNSSQCFSRVFSHFAYTSSHTSHTRRFSAILAYFTLEFTEEENKQWRHHLQALRQSRHKTIFNLHQSWCGLNTTYELLLLKQH